jgi:hypothetical protein
MLRITTAAKNWMAFFMVICFWLVIEVVVLVMDLCVNP